jgi:hypothetical protein
MLNSKLNEIHFVLEIEIDMPFEQIGQENEWGKYMKIAPANSKIKSIQMSPPFYSHDRKLAAAAAAEIENKEEYQRYLTSQELKEEVAYTDYSIHLKNNVEMIFVPSRERIIPPKTNNLSTIQKYFSFQDILNCLLQFEKIDRDHAKSKWFQGIDCHHIYFEGFQQKQKENGQFYYTPKWGS